MVKDRAKWSDKANFPGDAGGGGAGVGVGVRLALSLRFCAPQSSCTVAALLEDGAAPSVCCTARTQPHPQEEPCPLGQCTGKL